MAILEVPASDNRNLQNIANIVAAAKKIVVITGAGISTSSGIPDFRSEKGLYSLIQAQYDLASSTTSTVLPATDSSHSLRSPAIESPSERPLPTNVKGKDLFDSQLWSDPISTQVFYRFISSLREKIKQDVTRRTPTHRFLRTLRDRRKLVRCYTQNIDGLENREGLSTDLGLGKGNRQRFTKKSLERPLVHACTRPGGDLDAGCEVVQLHGELETLRCTLCQQTCSWDQQPVPHKAMLLAGTAPYCQYCLATDQGRQDRGKRGTKVGILRPNIILYGEEHPSADMLGSIMTHDLSLQPDVLIILGTSLHVHGVKTMVREFAKSIHAKADGKGRIIYVNLSKPSQSVWKDTIDYWVPMDCDAWVGAMRKHRPDLFQVQEQLKLPVKKPIKNPPSKKVRQHVAEVASDKENIIADGNALLSANKTGKPMVVIPASPKNKLPLQEREEGRAAPRDVKDAFQGRMTTTVSVPSYGPPQPLMIPCASSGNSVRKRRRTLAENYNGVGQPRSKRTKLPVTIWTDPCVGA